MIKVIKGADALLQWKNTWEEWIYNYYDYYTISMSDLI